MVPEAGAAAMGDRRTSQRRPGGRKKVAGKSLKRVQLVVASPLETIVALLKANVGPVVTAGTIKSKGIEFDTLKHLTRVENPANPTPEVTLPQSIS